MQTEFVTSKKWWEAIQAEREREVFGSMLGFLKWFDALKRMGVLRHVRIGE